MYDSKAIADRIRAVCDARGIKYKDMLRACGLGENTLQNMKTSIPKSDTLAMIADYLHISTDFLLGRDVSEMTSAPIETDRSELTEALSKLPREDRDELANLARLLLSKQQLPPEQADQ